MAMMRIFSELWIKKETLWCTIVCDKFPSVVISYGKIYQLLYTLCIREYTYSVICYSVKLLVKWPRNQLYVFCAKLISIIPRLGYFPGKLINLLDISQLLSDNLVSPTNLDSRTQNSITSLIDCRSGLSIRFPRVFRHFAVQ